MPELLAQADWIAIISQLGFPISLAVALLGAGWKAGTWLANNILVPLKDAHVKFIGEVSESSSRQADAGEKIATAVKVIGDNTAATQASVQQIAKSQADHIAICRGAPH